MVQARKYTKDTNIEDILKYEFLYIKGAKLQKLPPVYVSSYRRNFIFKKHRKLKRIS